MKRIAKYTLIFLMAALFSAFLFGCSGSKTIDSAPNGAIAAKSLAGGESDASLAETDEGSPVSESDTFQDAKPAVDINYKTITVCDGVMTLDIPDALEYEEPLPGSEYFAYGFLHDEDGEAHYCQVYITRIFQEEDPAVNEVVFQLMAEQALMIIHGELTDIERIQDVTLDGSEQGYITRVSCPDGMSYTTRYLFNIMSEGVYYQVNIYSDSGLIQEFVARKIMRSVQIDKDREKESVDAFKLDIRNGVYYSRRLEGASMRIPPICNPTESNAFIYENSIMSFAPQDNLGSVAVRRWDKSLYRIDDIDTMITITITEQLNTGFLSESAIEDIEYLIEPESGRILLLYPGSFYLYGDFIAEYEDAFYVINMVYNKDDWDLATGIIDACKTFKAPGEEIFQQ